MKTERTDEHAGSTATGSPPYRPDIDGLRAIAVLGVALFHADIPLLQGGFVGVDVFFVISGFLISSLIIGEMKRGQFSWVNFFERRARRLIPALFVVVLAITIASIALFTPRELRGLGENLVFLALFGSNFYFYQESDYFSGPAESYPLLHTWSLAVEEQFYFVFPVIIWFLIGRPNRQMTITIILLLVVSLIAAEMTRRLDRPLAFYHMPFRMWELLAGSTLALGLVPPPGARAARQIAATLGMVLVIGSFLLPGLTDHFPGLGALPAVLGTALLIWSGVNARPEHQSAVSRVLSLPLIVFIGLCSYSFYLWHWPLLVFGEMIALRPLSVGENCLLLCLGFVLSALSLYAIERPFRRQPRERASRHSRLGLLTAGGVAALFIAAGVGFQESRGWPERYSDRLDLDQLTSPEVTRYGIDMTNCRTYTLAPATVADGLATPLCLIGSEEAAPSFLVWGDSHAMSAISAVRRASENAGRTGAVSVYSGCPPYYEATRTDAQSACGRHNQATLAALKAMASNQVLLIASWRAIADGAPDRALELEHLVQHLSDEGIRVAISAPTPSYPVRIAPTVFRAQIMGVEPPIDASRERHDASTAKFHALARQLTDRFKIDVIPAADALCDSSHCEYMAEGVPLYADNSHLNTYGAARLQRLFSDILHRRDGSDLNN